MYAIILECQHAYFIDWNLTDGVHYAKCQICKNNGANLSWKYVLDVKPVRNVPEQPPVVLPRGWVFRTTTAPVGTGRKRINSPFIYKRRVH